jgi:S-disulfanyl-L-cysteine oxidoreductase SoxD
MRRAPLRCRRVGRAPIIAAFLLVLTIGAAEASSPQGEAASTPPHFADAADHALVQRGKAVYREACANCHGRNLQGQPLWQLLDQYAGRRAPAQDETGHTWQHSDEDIFQMIKDGRFPSAPPDQPSFMPGFAARLDDRDILAAMAFIKSRWPLALRVAQAMLNPGLAGMPADADRVEWRLPPTCSALLRLEGRAPR